MAMRYERPASLSEASLGDGAVALAGGTEVTPLLRDGLLVAHTLVDVREVVPHGIDGERIGGGTTLAEIERSAAVPEALREACRLAASPQLRNAASLAGNLLQATRCWYWRLGSDCWLRGGERCLARDGCSDEHAILGNASCASAHPSDPAAALLALGATVRTDRREFAVADLYRLPSAADRSTTTLEPGELILDLHVPVPQSSLYLKSMDRRRFAFPMVGVAAVRTGSEVRTALAGVAPVPWLLGGPDAVADLDEATPLDGSAYKVELARALVGRAHRALAAGLLDSVTGGGRRGPLGRLLR